MATKCRIHIWTSVLVLQCALAASAWAQVSIAAISDAQVTYDCLSYGVHNSGALAVNAAQYHDRAVFVFDKQMLPPIFSSATLELWRYGGNAAKVRVTAYSSTSPTPTAVEWDYQIDRLHFVGDYDLPYIAGGGTNQIFDLGSATSALQDEPERYLHVHLSSCGTICSSPACNSSFAGLSNASGSAGPRLVFALPVANQTSTLSGVKSLFR